MKKTFVLLCCLALTLVFPAAQTPLHAEDNTPKTQKKETDSPPAQTGSSKQKTSGTPDRFVPTDRVSADQAVAFPTDI